MPSFMDELIRKQPKTKIMTVDIEDYYQVGAFEQDITREQWSTFESRVVKNTERILKIFEKHQVKATFFVLGYVAQHHPELIRKIVAQGHEIASHGFYHQRVSILNRDEFKKDVLDSRLLLEEICGRPVIGYRAPSFSIDHKNTWAFDVLKEAGYIYSSSTYPIKHDHYGDPNGLKEPYRTESGLLEFPQATIELLGKAIPVGGGGYFRLSPYRLSELGIKYFHQQHDSSYIFYFHPWEIDPEQPKIACQSKLSHFRHYVNLKHMEGKVERLCASYQWKSFENCYDLTSY